jgi:hypothetical protein
MKRLSLPNGDTLWRRNKVTGKYTMSENVPVVHPINEYSGVS